MVIPPEVAKCASEAVALVAGAALKQLGRATDKLTDAAIEKGTALLSWLKTKLTGKPRDALEEVEKDPDDTVSQEAFGKRLEQVLAEDPQLLDELRQLLPPTTQENTKADQRVKQSGTGNVSIQVGRDYRTGGA